MFTKILVANRGAIAQRIIRACSELGVGSVAQYTQSEADAPYLEQASQTVELPGLRADETYLNQPAILAAL